MKRARAHTRPAWPAKHCGNIRAPAITTLRRIIGQQIEATRNEINELKLGDRFHSHQRRAARRADDRRFRDRCIDHSLLAEAIDQSFRDFEGAAIDAHIFADHEHGWIALHLFPNPGANRLDHRGGGATRWMFKFA